MAIPSINVNPERVITILKARLVDSITNASLLEAALEEALDREAALQAKVTELEGQDGP